MQATETDIDLATNDLGPLAWVLDELRKSLDSASAALRRFVRDTGAGARLRHGVGGRRPAAHRAPAAAPGRRRARDGGTGRAGPGAALAWKRRCRSSSSGPNCAMKPRPAKVERAGFALTDYLEGVLLGKPASAVALFPQYRDMQELAGADRIHPADLWAFEWRWNEPADAGRAPSHWCTTRRCGRAWTRRVLRLVKTGDASAARELAKISLALAAIADRAPAARSSGRSAPAFSRPSASACCRSTSTSSARASRVLLQYASLAKGELGVSDRLVQDLVFFCAQAVPAPSTDAPSLRGVRQAWGLARFAPVDYQTAQYGRFDPVLLAQARKRIGAAKDTWSALSGGDAGKIKGLADQFHLLTRLAAQAASGQRAAGAGSDQRDRYGRAVRPAPGPELAMEVATAVLYLEAAFQDLDPADAQLAARTARLAERLDTVRQGGQARGAGTLDGGAVPPRERPPDHGQRGGRTARHAGRAREAAGPVLPQPAGQGARCATRPATCRRCAACCRCWAWTRPRRPSCACARRVEEIIVTEIDEERVHAAGHLREARQQPRRARLPGRHAQLPADAGQEAVRVRRQPRRVPAVDGPRRATPRQEPLAAAADELSLEVSAMAAGAAAESREHLTAKLDTGDAGGAGGADRRWRRPPAKRPRRCRRRTAGAAAAALSSLAAVDEARAAQRRGPAAEPDIEEDDLLDIFLEEAREVVQNGLAAIDALAVQSGGDLRTHDPAPRLPHAQGQLAHGRADGVRRSRLVARAGAQHLAGRPEAGHRRAASACRARRCGGSPAGSKTSPSTTTAPGKPGMFRGPAEALRTENRLVPLTLPDKSRCAGRWTCPCRAGAATAAGRAEPAGRIRALPRRCCRRVPAELAAVDLPVQLDRAGRSRARVRASADEPAPRRRAARAACLRQSPEHPSVRRTHRWKSPSCRRISSSSFRAAPAVDPPEPPAAELEAQVDIEQRRLRARSRPFRLSPVPPSDDAAVQPKRPRIADLEVSISDSAGPFDLGEFGVADAGPSDRRWSPSLPRARAGGSWRSRPRRRRLEAEARRRRRRRRGTGQGDRDAAHRHPALQRLPQRGRRMVAPARHRIGRVGAGAEPADARLHRGPGARAGRQLRHRRIPHAVRHRPGAGKQRCRRRSRWPTGRRGTARPSPTRPRKSGACCTSLPPGS